MKDQSEDREILVALVDDNRISREEHAKLLNAEEGVTVVSAEATLTVTMLNDAQPDVVLMEVGDDDVLSLRAAVTAKRVMPDTSVVITDLLPENEEIADFVKAGVAGFVLKDASIDELVDTVRSVADGEHVLPDELTSSLFVQIAAEGIVLDDEVEGRKSVATLTLSLTLREKEIVALIGEGLANKEIAARLRITTHTVKAHVRNAMDKTGIRTRVLLAVRARHLKSD
jgi:DNA-binding NarL/FixJ family response regulator